MDKEKKIAEIREALRRVEFGTYRITAFADLEYWLRFLLSELDRIQQEYAEERAAHNAHVTELCELEKENRKLRERLKEELVWQDECLKLEEQLQSAHQEIERLREHVSRAWKACWKVAGDDTKLEQKLIECLQWYADTQNYKYPTVGGAGAKRPIDYDRGERARDILHEIGVKVE